MKSGTKKRLIGLILLVLILAGAFVAYYLVSNMKEDSASEPYVSPYITIIAEDSQTVTKLAYKLGEADELEFTHENYKWHYTGDETFPVNTYYLDEMAKAASAVTAIRQLEDGDNGEYGLGADALVIRIEYSDGNKYDISVGDLNSFNSYTYVKDNTNDAVYMFSDGVKEKFEKSLNDLIQLDDPQADVDTGYFISMDVTDGKGRTNVIEDTAGIREFNAQSDSYTCLDWVEYAMTEQSFEKYGINADSARIIIRYKAPVAVKDENGNDATIREERAYEIIFGDKVTAPDEDGNDAEYVYYTVTGSTIVYKAPIADYEASMAYLDYVPEDDETSADSEDTALSADTSDTEAQSTDTE